MVRLEITSDICNYRHKKSYSFENNIYPWISTLIRDDDT